MRTGPGSLTLPRGCGMPGACLVRFNLNTEEIGLSELSEWLGSRPGQRRWYQMLTSAETSGADVSGKSAGIGESERGPFANSQPGCGRGFPLRLNWNTGS